MDFSLAAARAGERSGCLQWRGSVPRVRGFTLIELMITVAIVAVLAAVAYPSYTSHLAKGRRAAAQSYLMDLAQRQTQFLVDNRAYANSEGALGATPPAEVGTYYNAVAFTVQAGPPPSFVMTLAPKTGTAQANDATLSINQAGQKLPADKW